MRINRPVLGLVAAGLLLAACSSDGDDGNALEGTEPATPTATPALEVTPTSEPTQADAAPESTATPVPQDTPTPEAPQSGLPPVQLEVAFNGATFEGMTGLYQDAEGNWYVTEQPGRIWRMGADTSEPALFLDITDRVVSGGEMGLLGFALAPDFETSHHFYVDYTGGGQTFVSRFTASPDNTSADPSTEQAVLQVAQPASNHNGGQIAFGPDGYLYVALGDGGGANDTFGNGQNLGTLLATILRIDVSGGGEYAVPADNPFLGTEGARPEIWAYGLRNPWRFSFDRATGDLWAGDVGQSAREEIDIIVAGGNYGWPITEGTECTGVAGCDTEGLLPPVFDYVRGSGGTCSVTGGFVYRGDAIPGLRGAYLFSDYCSGVIYALRATDGVLTEQAEITSTGTRVSAFAQDNDGELYVLEIAGAGRIFKIVP